MSREVSWEDPPPWPGGFHPALTFTGGYGRGMSAAKTLWTRLAQIGVAASDPEDLRVAKSTFTLVAGLVTVMASIWVITFLLLDRPLSASIPFTFQVASIISLVYFSRTKNFVVMRRIQTVMFSTFPFLLQWSLGGYVNSSAVSVWAMVTPVVALFFGGRPATWIGVFISLTVVSAAIDSRLDDTIPVPTAARSAFWALNFVCVAIVYVVSTSHFVGQRNRFREQLRAEQATSERLLLNVLPPQIARRLGAGESPIVDERSAVTVLFVDIVDFTRQTRSAPPKEVVSVLNGVFSEIDDLADAYGLDKIKTLGDGYMLVAGATEPRADHLALALDAALAARDRLSRHRLAGVPIRVRMGLDTGPAIAGVVGHSRFSYDVWGDAVNTASRMESHGLPGEIHVTERVRDLACDQYEFTSRGLIDVKGLGEMETFLLVGRRLESDRVPGAERDGSVETEDVDRTRSVDRP
jgi:adenylate cyclase